MEYYITYKNLDEIFTRLDNIPDDRDPRLLVSHYLRVSMIKHKLPIGGTVCMQHGDECDISN